ncbi:hypothetical protein NOM01_04475 [Sporolactobacillus sp. STSJ-5]|uniref:hypothetical protein n=1 Tax=Sporolactobacillus sp. STSJ-5 TaxID=2965076 RepID=UPI00210750D7|nr:hypothetical protein [Sporolactobacillus sp. STSJ-5]MCQ2009249.1 hypothetical protein [Sporolactobacillus sp. STSJ-5]
MQDMYDTVWRIESALIGNPLKDKLTEVFRQPSLTDRQEQLIEKKQAFRKFVCTMSEE